MASLPSDQSQELDFVEEPPRDFLCPVSLELLREPHQTLCCGRHISRDSVTLLQTQNQPCPLCRKENLKTLPDQYFKRKIHELKVRCPSKISGCEWVGELGELERHLENCPLQEVNCEFSHLGCEVRVKRRKISEHVEESVKTHLSMACKTIQQQMVTQQKQMRMITNLQQQIDELESITKPVFLAPPRTLVMTNFSEHKREDDEWFSTPFYSHIGGYKMTLRVRANGQGVAEDSHVSVYFHLMRGEFDDDLPWPFRGSATVQLVNQREDQGHVMLTFTYEDEKAVSSRRVMERGTAKYGRGLAKFISHDDLGYDEYKNTQFLKDDCLEFRIPKIAAKK